MKFSKMPLLVMSALSLLSVSQPSFAATTEEIARGNCNTCATACDDTIKYCGKFKDNRSNPTVINSLRDASIACRMTGAFLEHGSAFSKKSAALCLEALTQCTKSCESFTKDNNIKACADECRKTTGNLSKVIESK